MIVILVGNKTKLRSSTPAHVYDINYANSFNLIYIIYFIKFQTFYETIVMFISMYQ